LGVRATKYLIYNLFFIFLKDIIVFTVKLRGAKRKIGGAGRKTP